VAAVVVGLLAASPFLLRVYDAPMQRWIRRLGTRAAAAFRQSAPVQEALAPSEAHAASEEKRGELA
jgi:peptidoglycan/LPS O-acetylase OafA/YrhL